MVGNSLLLLGLHASRGISPLMPEIPLGIVIGNNP